jgi:general secretion pathway protein I
MRARGFTLLEVLVALVVIGVALAAAMRGALALTGSSVDARRILLATITAENRLLELRLTRDRLELGQTATECAEGGVAFICEQIVKPTPNPFFRRVELRVLFQDGDTQRRYAEMMSILPTNQ